MFEASDLRKGLKIEIDGEPYIVTSFEFCKPGKGQALYRCKLKHMLNNTTTDRTFRSADRIGKPNLETRDAIYSHEEGEIHVFMDAETYEQYPVTDSIIGENRRFLKPDIECEILFYKERPVEVTLPFFIEAQVTQTEPGARGDTATNVTKTARLDNGHEVQVPLFINEGDLIKVDTRTGNYSERLSKA